MMSPIILSAALAAGCGGGVEIRLASERTFDVEARNVPVATVLACLAERAGFKLTQDGGAAIRQPLTIRLDGRTAVQAVDRILEGVSVNYALARDPEEGRIVMLLITARGGGATSAGGAAPGGVFPGGGPSRPPEGMTAPRRIAPFRPPEPEPPQPDEEPDMEEEIPAGGGALQHPFVPPLQSPLYPEAQPLSPLSLRAGKRLPARAEAAPAGAGGLRSSPSAKTLR